MFLLEISSIMHLGFLIQPIIHLEFFIFNFEKCFYEISIVRYLKINDIIVKDCYLYELNP
jgi:hypothetical protein